MRNVMPMVLVAILSMAVGSAVPLVKAAPGDQQQEDMPHHTARAFAPFIRALVTHRENQADKIFKMHRSVVTALEQTEDVRILSRFQKPDQLELNLVGGRTLGQNIGILFFTVATEEGPVAFKIYYYGYGDTVSVARIDLTDDWDEVERLALTVDSLPSPIAVQLGQVGDENPQGGG